MKLFSLRSLIDDILLLVRNNNISESEDLSRAQIAGWILAYKAYLAKQKFDQDQAGAASDESSLTSMMETRGPLELETVESLDDTPLFTKRTKNPIPDLLDHSEDNLISVFDQQGCPIQKMNEKRRFFHFSRKYTFGEMVAWYEQTEDGGHVYIKGLTDLGRLKYIWITGIFSGEDADEDEDSINIPGWMIPDIKKLILNNELAFMLRMPSDDDNNSTLDGIKPAGPQSNEK